MKLLKAIYLSLWNMFKQFLTPRGIIAYIIVWLALSGVGLMGYGLIFNRYNLVALGGVILAFWAGPFSPLVPIVMLLSGLLARYILRDKNIALSKIIIIFKKEFQYTKLYSKYHRNINCHGIVFYN